MDCELSIDGELAIDDEAARLRSARRRARYETRALLIAVLTVVMLVTLPRLHGIALRENELDALRVLDLLAPQVLAAEGAAAVPLQLGSFLDQHRELEDRLADVERLEDGRLVRRHGYLFELARIDGRPCLRAWPFEHGRTGLGVFISLPAAAIAGELDDAAADELKVALLAHPNEARDGAAPWSGPGRAPVPDLVATSPWRRVVLPGSLTESY